MLSDKKRKSTLKTEVVVLATITLSLSFIWASCSKSVNPAAPNIASTSVPTDTAKSTKPVYTLVWADEFNGTTVDTSKWVFEKGPSYNNELEYYQAANATVGNGNLMITAKLESVGGKQYTSARLNTQGKEAPTYGRIEARIKMPMGAGFWPAFWMAGTNISSVGWPACGEVDIMEHINADNIIHGTMHWALNGQHTQDASSLNVSNLSDYHLYAIEWDQNQIRWYVDSTLYKTGNIQNNVNNTGAFHLPFFILLNFAVGGDFPNTAVNNSLLPATMYVDYVRVYKQTN